VGYGPLTQMPVFNNLITFDLAYKGISPETIIGDLAESWETSADGTEITFKLRQGVKWHDGMPFTADDVVYSLDKMTDPNRSVVYADYPAYQSAEKLDDYTVKVTLKYPSAGYMMALAGAYSLMLPKHLAGTDHQSLEFMVGTGPFIPTETVVGVHTRMKRNPEYFKKDQYGNQLPYLDALYLIDTGAGGDDLLIARRLDVRNLVVSGSSLEVFNTIRAGAPEILWQKTVKSESVGFFLNLTKSPLDDIRVRRALAMVLDEEGIIIGYSGDPSFGIPGSGFLPPSMGLSQEEVSTLMGWDKPYEQRVADAMALLSEAGYPNGFKLEILAQRASGAPTVGHPGASLVLADTLRRYLNIDVTVQALSRVELEKRIQDNNYHVYCQTAQINDDPSKLVTWFGTNAPTPWPHYSNARVDSLLENLDRVIDPDQRQQDIWEIERILLTDLPVLPTGVFPTRHMFYYPHVKNLRWQTPPYSAICRLEDVWIDPALKPANFATE